MLFVIVTENSLAEVFYLTDETGLLLVVVAPALLITEAVHDIMEQPLQDDIRVLEVVYQLVDSQFLHLVTTESHPQVCRQVQFAGKVPEHTLEERVYRLHTESCCSYAEGVSMPPRHAHG